MLATVQHLAWLRIADLGESVFVGVDYESQSEETDSLADEEED
jgi:hypothetical protein